MWEEMGWDEKSWDEVRRAHMIWDEMKCGVWTASVQCEVWGKFSLGVALHQGRARVMFLDNNTLQQLRTKHARTDLAGAQRMQVLYRWEKVL